ncbi:cytochrome c oxidase accessory protein CcoG [Pararhodospirillum oryzae]|uniref:4Fe-4S ferredoxin n=1 Tax=Pararhodospirillum oryzae TaxID=478448 RepID=A0A512H6H0_9PROT|nr:cytochrome c oxidase accessory protein CcoG [Pararhodospirillum oryzae]GEO81059.1 4Fe-4S ferredoxin [Pararhodospirillum oryzae]
MYESHRKVYPRSIQGRYRTLKWLSMGLLLGIFWGGPWVRWNRGPGVADQALFIDLPGRRAYFFDLEFWPQEVFYLTGALVFAAVLLFFATALLGRVWCGFACFQTVFTDLFVLMERLIEGERPRRLALDAAPWTPAKIARKGAKAVAWGLVAVAVGAGFTLYFFPDPAQALGALVLGQAPAAAYGAIAVVGGGCFLLAGYAREQVCIYMCPYGRFQGAMTDEHSYVVTYAAWRGEPRAPYQREADFSRRGHCIDCGLCVQVCPTGVDIRKGSQLACIGCALCVDACAKVMRRFNLPPGLIAYDSAANQAARARGEAPVTRWLRPRTLIYASVLLGVLSAIVVSIATRPTFDLTVLHERSPLFVTLSDGSIRNGYTIKLMNMSRRDAAFRISVEGLAEPVLTSPTLNADPAGALIVPVAGAHVETARLYIAAPNEVLAGTDNTVTLVLTDVVTGKRLSTQTLFAAPP